MEIVCKSCPYNISIDTCQNAFKDLKQWRYKDSWFEHLVYCPVFHPVEVEVKQSIMGEYK